MSQCVDVNLTFYFQYTIFTLLSAGFVVSESKDPLVQLSE